MTKPLKIIKIAEVLAPIMSSRDVVDNLLAPIRKADIQSVVLDFTDVDFISRSAAHELLLLQEEFHQKRRELSFENTNSDISQMIRTVAANRALPEHPKPTFKAERMNINSLI